VIAHNRIVFRFLDTKHRHDSKLLSSLRRNKKDREFFMLSVLNEMVCFFG